MDFRVDFRKLHNRLVVLPVGGGRRVAALMRQSVDQVRGADRMEEISRPEHHSHCSHL